jgi:hypothetical protein
MLQLNRSATRRFASTRLVNEAVDGVDVFLRALQLLGEFAMIVVPQLQPQVEQAFAC